MGVGESWLRMRCVRKWKPFSMQTPTRRANMPPKSYSLYTFGIISRYGTSHRISHRVALALYERFLIGIVSNTRIFCIWRHTCGAFKAAMASMQWMAACIMEPIKYVSHKSPKCIFTWRHRAMLSPVLNTTHTHYIVSNRFNDCNLTILLDLVSYGYLLNAERFDLYAHRNWMQWNTIPWQCRLIDGKQCSCKYRTRTKSIEPSVCMCVCRLEVWRTTISHHNALWNIAPAFTFHFWPKLRTFCRVTCRNEMLQVQRRICNRKGYGKSMGRRSDAVTNNWISYAGKKIIMGKQYWTKSIRAVNHALHMDEIEWAKFTLLCGHEFMGHGQ